MRIQPSFQWLKRTYQRSTYELITIFFSSMISIHVCKMHIEISTSRLLLILMIFPSSKHHWFLRRCFFIWTEPKLSLNILANSIYSMINTAFDCFKWILSSGLLFMLLFTGSQFDTLNSLDSTSSSLLAESFEFFNFELCSTFYFDRKCSALRLE